MDTLIPALPSSTEQPAPSLGTEQPAPPPIADRPPDSALMLLWSLSWIIGAVASPFVMLGGPVYLGVMQGLLLRRYISSVNGWLWAILTTIGVVAGPAAALVAGLLGWAAATSFKSSQGLRVVTPEMGEYARLNDNDTFLVAAALAGLVGATVLAVCQWPILRSHVKSAWRWIPAHSVAGLLGGIVVALGMAWTNSQDELLSYLPIVLGVAVCGAISGVTIRLLLRDS